MTPRKRWPNEVDWARQDSIAQAKRGLGVLDVIDKIEDPEALRRINIATDSFHRIIECLVVVGPESEFNQPIKR